MAGITACGTSKVPQANYSHVPVADTTITESLFTDRSSSISEENIQKILDGSYKLPQQLRIAVVRLDPAGGTKRYYWNDEQYIKSQQAYLDQFVLQLRQSPRVVSVTAVPDMLIAKNPGFTTLREAAVRMQADLVLVYSINSDLYSKYKPFAKPEIKAFATSQLILLDVRTGLVPFSTMVTRDVLSQRSKEELDNYEAAQRIQREAVLETITAIGEQMKGFFNGNSLGYSKQE
ncbi:hypothetical protein FPE01S_02_06910 [Flavihumibacter petaseus NBRC 106054]|uniref:Lipoprotein n=2 Tax=Flavihumibacter TaxID=1004301 RepID=A0A0E9N2M8_9BACT|nr:hypothetical protein FPE01S_02_06910 [Flavihumibacter petaseus NBRC 106054]